MIPLKTRFVIMTILLTLAGYFMYSGVEELAGGLGGFAKIGIGIFVIMIIAYYGLFK